MIAGKSTHKQANYRASKSDNERCGTCSMYVASKPPSCTAVVDPIRPYDVCKYWEPKKEDKRRAA